MTQIEAELKVVALKNAYNELRKKITDEYIIKIAEVERNHFEEEQRLNTAIGQLFRELAKAQDKEQKSELEIQLKEQRAEMQGRRILHLSNIALIRAERENTICYEKHKMQNAIAQVMAEVNERGDRYWKAMYDELKAQVHGA